MVAMLYLRNNQIPNLALNRPNPPPNTPAMIICNTIPNLVISFGTAPLHEPSNFIINTGIQNNKITGLFNPNDVVCTAAGLPGYQITIPSNLLFNGFPGGVPQGTPNNFTIDLWEVQQQILYYLASIAFTLCCYIIFGNF